MNGDIPGFAAGHAGEFALPDHARKKLRPPCRPHSHALDKLHEHVERAIHGHYRDQRYLVEKTT